MSVDKVGWIGLGSIGLPMARNLVRKGFEVNVVGHSRRTPVDAMKAEGANEMSSLRDLASRCLTIFSVVWDAKQTEEIIFGKDGLIEGLTENHVLVICSTIAPDYCAAVAERVKREKGARVISAPVSGMPWGAESASLSFMVGGEKSVFEKCLPYFEAMGKNIFHVGESVEAGLAAKLTNQLMFLVNGAAALEGLAFARKTGVDIPQLLEVVKSSTGDSFVVRNFSNLMKLMREHPDTNKMARKDLEIALEYAAKNGLELPLARLASKGDYTRQ